VPDDPPVVLVVDDDAAVLKALTRLLRASGYDARPFASAQDYLQASDPDAPCCIVLDIAMPGISGIELQDQLSGGELEHPIVFLTGHGDVPTSVRAMKAGAVDFLTKPVGDAELIAAIDRAIAQDRAARHARAARAQLDRLVASLTPREREVLGHVVAGRLNKQIAASLGTAEKTIKVHRHRVMEKMQVRTLADLVRVAVRAGAGPES